MVANASKAALRSKIGRLRRGFPPARCEREQEQTCRTLAGWLERNACRHLASYAAVGGELDLLALHRSRWSDALPVLLPRVTDPANHRMVWHPVTGPEQLRPGFCGISEPFSGREVPLPEDVVILVPGIAFDRTGYRLGQGGGFYDCLLAALPAGTVTIGIGFTCQLVPTLPLEPHDRVLSGLIIGGVWIKEPVIGLGAAGS